MGCKPFKDEIRNKCSQLKCPEQASLSAETPVPISGDSISIGLGIGGASLKVKMSAAISCGEYGYSFSDIFPRIRSCDNKLFCKCTGKITVEISMREWYDYDNWLDASKGKGTFDKLAWCLAQKNHVDATAQNFYVTAHKMIKESVDEQCPGKG
jgi:hypothetical protein